MSEHGGEGAAPSGGGHGGGSDGVIASMLAKIGFSVNTDGLEKLNHKLTHLTHVVKVIAGVEILHAITELGERYAGLGESLESAAIQTGLTTDELQKLQYAASQNAISADDMTMGLTRLGRVMFQAQQGSKGAVATFERLGISQEQISSFTNTREAFLAVADGINALGTQQEKLATIQAILGRGGAKYLKLIAQGSEAIAQDGERAVRVGALVSHKNIENLASFEDAFSSIRLVMSRFLANVAGTFVPGITRGLRAVEEAWGENKETVMRTLKTLGGELALFTYAGVQLFKVFSTLVHNILNGGDGIGGSIHQFIEGVKADVMPVFVGFKDALVEIAKNGSLGDIFLSLQELFHSILSAGKDVGDFLAGVTSAIGMLGGANTSGLSSMQIVLSGVLSVFKALIDTATTFFNLISYYFGGQIFKDLTFLGGAALSGSLSKIGINGQRQEQIGAGLSKAAHVIGREGETAFIALQQTTNEAGNFLSGGTDQYSIPKSWGPSVVVKSEVNVTVPPGSEAKEIAAAVTREQEKNVGRIYSEARRDLEHPMEY